jgi:hypothetical protein
LKTPTASRAVRTPSSGDMTTSSEFKRTMIVMTFLPQPYRRLEEHHVWPGHSQQAAIFHPAYLGCKAAIVEAKNTPVAHCDAAAAISALPCY